MTQTDNSKSALEISTILAKKASETKDWRIRDKRSRAFKALATELINSEKTLIEATLKSLLNNFHACIVMMVRSTIRSTLGECFTNTKEAMSNSFLGL